MSNVATILSGAALSDAVDCGPSQRVTGIVMPAGWDAASMTFQGSLDGSTFQNLFDGAGVELALATPAASRNLVLTEAQILALKPWRQIKVRSGPSSLPVNQTANRLITLALSRA